MMENEERHASYAAAAGSKVQQNESVLDSWEDAALDGQRSQELERSIEEKLGLMKQKQSGLISASSATTSNHLDVAAYDSAFPRSMQGESHSSADLTAAATAPPILRILKRPQSSGHLPQHGHQHHPQSKQSTSASAHVAKNGNFSRSGGQQQQQRTLEERAAAYAEARMRIFGVADQQIHDDLPVQPKLSLMPGSNESSPSSNSNR